MCNVNPSVYSSENSDQSSSDHLSRPDVTIEKLPDPGCPVGNFQYTCDGREAFNSWNYDPMFEKTPEGDSSVDRPSVPTFKGEMIPPGSVRWGI